MQRHYRSLRFNYYGDLVILQAESESEIKNKNFIYTNDILNRLEITI